MLLLWDDDVKAKKNLQWAGAGPRNEGGRSKVFLGLDAQVTEEGYSDLSLPGP